MTIQVGDRVGYSAAWLRSTGQMTGDVPFARGTVTRLDTFGSGTVIARVRWDAGFDMPGGVYVANLAKVGSSAFSA